VCVCSGSATTLQPIILYVRAYPADRIATLTLPSAVLVRSFARANALEPPVAEISYLGHLRVLAHPGELYYRQIVRTC
jgi:hypothetical protein